MLGMDEPVHGRLRSLVSKAFSQKALARWEDELVGRVGNSLIDKFAANGKADLVKEFTFDYPSQIIAGLLGLPQEDYPQFQRWSISLLSWILNPERGLAASAALCDYFAPILASRRAEPKDDLISGLAQAEIDGEKLEDEEIYCSCACCYPPEWRRPTGRWAACCWRCCPIPRNSTPSAPTGRCRRPSRKACGGNRPC